MTCAFARSLILRRNRNDMKDKSNLRPIAAKAFIGAAGFAGPWLESYCIKLDGVEFRCIPDFSIISGEAELISPNHAGWALMLRMRFRHRSQRERRRCYCLEPSDLLDVVRAGRTSVCLHDALHVNGRFIPDQNPRPKPGAFCSRFFCRHDCSSWLGSVRLGGFILGRSIETILPRCR